MIQIEVLLSSNNDMLSKSSKINIFYNLHTQIECLKVKNWNEKIAGKNSTTTKKTIVVRLARVSDIVRWLFNVCPLLSRAFILIADRSKTWKKDEIESNSRLLFILNHIDMFWYQRKRLTSVMAKYCTMRVPHSCNSAEFISVCDKLFKCSFPFRTQLAILTLVTFTLRQSTNTSKSLVVEVMLPFSFFFMFSK